MDKLNVTLPVSFLSWGQESRFDEWQIAQLPFDANLTAVRELFKKYEDDQNTIAGILLEDYDFELKCQRYFQGSSKG